MYDLKQRIEAMRHTLDSQEQVTEIPVSSELFVTPDAICARMVAAARINHADSVLEPQAGTGAILRAIIAAVPEVTLDAVELNDMLYRQLVRHFPTVNVTQGDFLDYSPVLRYSKILMNPPFHRGQDIKHILHARSLLRPGGILVAICADGPRQKKILEPLTECWEPLPRGSFSYTNVSTVMLTLSV